MQYPSRYPPPPPQDPRTQRRFRVPPPNLPYKSLFGASVSLLAFSTLTGLALAAWFSKATDPWTWKSLLALACTVLGVATSALVWRLPSRESLLGGMAVMLVSLLRVGPVGEWTWVSACMVVVTLALLAPLVHALLLLPRG